MKRESKYFNIQCLCAVVMAIIGSVTNADPVGLTGDWIIRSSQSITLEG